MGIELYWTESAEYELHKIFKHYLKKAGYRIAKKLTDGIHDEPSKLKTHPEIGQVEQLLDGRSQAFRYLNLQKELQNYLLDK